MNALKVHQRSADYQIRQNGFVPQSPLEYISPPSSPTEKLLSPFSEEERLLILSVVKRDLEVRCKEKHRLRQIRKGLLQQDSRAPLTLPGTSRNCPICKVTFMLLINPKFTCSLCRREICKNCSKNYDKELLCRLCSHDIFYRAMACNWFYDDSPNKSSTYASDTIVRNLFKEKYPGIQDFNEDQLYLTVSSYLRPENGNYVNGKVYTPEMLKRNRNDQIRKFGKRYQEVRNKAVNSLGKVRANSSKHSQEEVDREIEKITQQFVQQTKEAIRKLLQMLCIIEEKYRMSLDSPVPANTGLRVLEITQRQIEGLVGHNLKVPDEYMKSEADEDLESYVASVTGGPEEFFATALLEDLKNAMKTSQSNGKLPRNP